MADGFALEIDEDLARDIERRAAEVGVSREDYARQILSQSMFDSNDYVWRNGNPRTATKDVDRGQPGTHWDVLEPQLWARLEANLALRR